MSSETTTTWHPAGDDDSSTVDLGGPCRKRSRLADPHQAARAALASVQERLEELYLMAAPFVQAVSTLEARALCQEVTDLCDALGRIKIGLLPRS